MSDASQIMKMVGIALLIPIIFAVPMVVFGKATNTWLESSRNKKDRISLCLCLCVVFFCIIQIILSFGNEVKQSLFNAIILLSLALHFSAKEIRKQGGYKATTLSGRQSEALELSIAGAWRSKGHWGAIAEFVVLISCIYIQL